LVRSVPDLYSELAQARASISQCGYNTAMEIIQAQLPALVVPFADGGEDEQLKRARRLEALSAMRVLEQKQLTPKRMAGYPNVPTVAESGLPGFELSNTYTWYVLGKSPAAVVQAKAKLAAQAALSSLNPTDQYLLLVGLLADLHAQFGGEVPRSNVVEVPRSERKPTTLSQPPVSPPAAAVKRAAVEAEEEVEEPKPRATPRAKAARPKATAAKSRSRA